MTRLTLAALFVLLVSSVVRAAPAPCAKPPRHAPSPTALMQGFLAEDFDLRGLERGPEPGQYRLVVAITHRNAGYLYVSNEAFDVRVSGDVRGQLRAFLIGKRPALSQWDLPGYAW